MRKLILIIALLLISTLYPQPEGSAVSSQGSSDNIANTLVRRDANGDFVAGSIIIEDSLGIGLPDPISQLHIESDGVGAQITVTGKTDDTADAAILLSAKGATNVQGVKLWYDRNTAYGYIDNLYNNNAGNIYIRTKTAGTPIIALTILGTGNVGIGTASPSSIFHIKASIPGLVGSHQAGQLIIQNPADDVNANAAITAYESDGSGDPDQQLWYLGSHSGSNENIALLNRRNANIHFGTNDITRFSILAGGGIDILTNNITGSGLWQAGIIPFSKGGTGFSNWTEFLIPYASSITSIGQIAIGASGQVLTSGGAGVAPSFQNVAAGGYSRHIELQVGSAVVGGTAPSPTTVGTFRGLGFSADNEVANFIFDVPTDWDGVSDMVAHVHWYPTSGDAVANGETVKWDITYRSIAEGEAVDNGSSVTTSGTLTGGVSETDKELYYTEIIIDYDHADQPLTFEDCVGIQFDRDVAGDSYSGAGIVTMLHIEYNSIALPEG